MNILAMEPADQSINCLFVAMFMQVVIRNTTLSILTEQLFQTVVSPVTNQLILDEIIILILEQLRMSHCVITCSHIQFLTSVRDLVTLCYRSSDALAVTEERRQICVIKKSNSSKQLVCFMLLLTNLLSCLNLYRARVSEQLCRHFISFPDTLSVRKVFNITASYTRYEHFQL